jgi:hypothetical protein
LTAHLRRLDNDCRWDRSIPWPSPIDTFVRDEAPRFRRSFSRKKGRKRAWQGHATVRLPPPLQFLHFGTMPFLSWLEVCGIGIRTSRLCQDQTLSQRRQGVITSHLSRRIKQQVGRSVPPTLAMLVCYLGLSAGSFDPASIRGAIPPPPGCTGTNNVQCTGENACTGTHVDCIGAGGGKTCANGGGACGNDNCNTGQTNETCT